MTMYLCMHVCMYVCTLATAYTVWANKLKFEPGSHHMINSKCIFHFFEKIIYFWVIPRLSFFTIFFISRLWTCLLRKWIRQIKATTYWKTVCIVCLYWTNYDVIKWRHRYQNLIMIWLMYDIIHLSYKLNVHKTR